MRIVRHRLPPEPLSASRGLLGLGLSSSSSSLGRHGLGGGGGGFGVGGVFGVGAGGRTTPGRPSTWRWSRCARR